MKKYRLKEEVKKYFGCQTKDEEKPLEFWSLELGVSAEALEEVPQRIELKLDAISDYVYKRDGKWNIDDLRICEKALNGELLDIDSLDDFQFKRSFIDFMIGEKGDTKDKDFVASTLNALKQYLKEKQNGQNYNRIFLDNGWLNACFNSVLGYVICFYF
jgi:hypothetical protein